MFAKTTILAPDYISTSLSRRQNTYSAETVHSNARRYKLDAQASEWFAAEFSSSPIRAVIRLSNSRPKLWSKVDYYAA